MYQICLCGAYMNSEKLYKNLMTMMSLLLLFAMILLSREAAIYTSGKMAQKKNITVVIDSGHGGRDPGKAAADGTLEKDLNLAISLKLQKYLEAADINVVMIRTTDCGLYDEDAPNKKVQDMKNRIAIMNAAEVDLVVSIHQNSYQDHSIKGAQVFYHSASSSGKILAETLQQALIENVDPDNHRKAKPNSSYYLLENTISPAVIVECGFLSNPSESQKLKSESYQDELAWAIHMAILQHINASS